MIIRPHSTLSLRPVLFALVLVWSSLVSSAPVTVLLKESHQVASDLEHEGKVLSEQEILSLRSEGLDISTLKPDQSTDYWKEELVGSDVQEDKLVDSDKISTFTYLNPVGSEVGTVRIAVEGEAGKQYLIQFSRNNHKMLMWKALLQKLGYNVPPVQWLPEAKLKINSALIEDLTKTLAGWAGEPKSWIVDKNKNELHLQDVLIFESHLSHYHLATGYIPGSVKKTRLFNALPVAYSLLSYPDSGLDLMGWTYGSISQDLLLLDFSQNISGYSPKYEDARWIARMILDLSRNDLVDIVAASKFPPEIQAYLLEKIVSRRNDLGKKLNLDASDMSFNKGLKIKTAKVSGFADTFKSTPAESPLSKKQLIPYGEALLQSSVIDAAIGKFNSALMPATDIGKKIQEKNFQAFIKQIKNFMETGEEKNIPFGAYAFPFGETHLIMSRDVVTGSYMGNKNLVQKADTFGFSVLAGTFVGFNGLPANLFADVRGQVYFSRIYSHIKPLKEIRSVFKEPYMNIFVETKRREVLSSFEDLMNKVSKGETLSKEDLISVKSQIDKAFPVGDSLVITDSLGSSLAGTVGYGLHNTTAITASASMGGRIIKRMHIIRLNEKLLQIYLNDANVNNLSIQVDLNSLIPVMNISKSSMSADVKVDLYELNLDTEQEPTLAAGQFKGFYEVLKHVRMRSDSSTPKIQSMNVMKSSEKSFGILGFKIGSQDTKYNLKIEDKEKGSRNFLRLRKSSFEDLDLLKPAQDIPNAAINKFVTTDYNFDIQQSSVAGENFLGKSNIFDASFDVISEGNKIEQAFYSSVRLRKKWKLGTKEILKHVTKANIKAGAVIFDPNLFNSTTGMQFYTMKYQTIVYEKGIKKLLVMSHEELLKVLTLKSNLSEELRNSTYEKLSALSKGIISHINKYKKLEEKGSQKNLKYLLNGVMKLDKVLTFSGMQNAFGKANVVLLPSINGFKSGDMSGYDTIRGNVLGKLSSQSPYGPIVNISQNTTFIDSEFLSSWLVRSFQ